MSQPTGPTARFTDAVAFAVAHHIDDDGRPHLRKGTAVPYLSHLLSVAALVWEAGGDETMAVAAVLHDVLEDTRVTPELLGQEFGTDVVALVQACSDGTPGQSRGPRTWRARKQAYVEHLGSAPYPVLVISGADKLHNGQSIVTDAELDALDPSRTPVWERFNAAPAEVLWYYRAVLAALEPLRRPSAQPPGLAGAALHVRLTDVVDRLGSLIPAP